MIRGKEKFKSGNFKFFTGVQETSSENWFSGNDYEMYRGQKKQSLILFHLLPTTGHILLYYFGHYYIENRELRNQFIVRTFPILEDLEVETIKKYLT